MLAVLGENGAGKSTLLSILGMLDADWRGDMAGGPHEPGTSTDLVAIARRRPDPGRS